MPSCSNRPEGARPFCPIRVGGTGEDADSTGLPLESCSVDSPLGPSGPGEAGFFSKSSSAIEGTRRMGEFGVAPRLLPRVTTDRHIAVPRP